MYHVLLKVIGNNVGCIFRIDLIHLQQKSLQEYVKTITCTNNVHGGNNVGEAISLCYIVNQCSEIRN